MPASAPLSPIRPLIVALTGGICSGKSTVADYFRQRGIPVVDTDVLARELVQPGQPALTEILNRFGQNLRGPDGGLDRSALRRRVFADPAERAALEAILHPRIRALSLKRLRALCAPWALWVVPLLAETGFQRDADRVLVVDAPRALQRARLQARDGLSAEEADQMLAAQASRAQRLTLADDVITNDGPREALYRQLDALDQRYRSLAGARRADDD